MTALKNFLLGALAMVAIVFLLKSMFCKWFCPPCEAKIPNPTIHFKVPDVETANFGVTAHPVTGATSAKLTIIDDAGNLVENTVLNFNTLYPVVLPDTAKRPIQLIFDYQSGQNQTVALDSIKVDDRKTGGNPPMEIIIGAVVGGQQSCPNQPTNVSVTGSPLIQKFNWEVGKTYKITFAQQGGNTEVIMTTSASGSCYKAEFWKQSKYSCLTNPTMSNTDQSNSELKINLNTGFVNITGVGHCSGSKEITMTFSGGFATVTVVSD